MFSTVQLIMVSGQCPSYLIITRRDPGIDKTCPEEKKDKGNTHAQGRCWVGNVEKHNRHMAENTLQEVGGDASLLS